MRGMSSDVGSLDAAVKPPMDGFMAVLDRHTPHAQNGTILQ